MPELIDSHSHIDDDCFAPDRGAVIERARARGVAAQVVPAVEAATWPRLRQVCAAHAGLHPAYGLHPLYLERHRPGHLDELGGWLRGTDAVAVGECGLDHWHADADRQAQERCFVAQLELAAELDLPVIVHARKAYDQVAAALARIGGLRGVIHAFAGSPVQAERFWRLGFHLGIGGPVTYERARRLRAIVADMPLPHLLLETDSPDQPLSGHQGQRNEPARLADVLAVVAALRRQSPNEVAQASSANARRLFAL